MHHKVRILAKIVVHVSGDWEVEALLVRVLLPRRLCLLVVSGLIVAQVARVPHVQ